ncbi:MAG: hypothetical protein VW082_08675 [Candidatus Nanopelagicales bacterium]
MSAALITRRIGSRWCCAWQVGVTLVILGLVLSAGLTLRLGWPDYFRATAAELVADAAAAAVLAVAAFTVLRSRHIRHQPVWLVLAVWVLVAAVRLGCFALLAPEVVGSILTFNVAIPVWALVIVYVYAGFDDGRAGAREIAEANTALLGVQEDTQELIDQQRQQLQEVVQRQIVDEVAHLRESVRQLDQPGAAADVMTLANQVSQYSTQVVREASHRLREPDAVLLGPNLRPGSAQVSWPSVVDVYRRARQPILVPIALITMRGVIGSVLRWDPSTLLAQGLIFTCLLTLAWAGRAAIERWIPRPSLREVCLSTALIFGLALVSVWGFALARATAPDNPNLIPLPAIGIFVFGVFFVGRLVSGVNLRWEQVTAELVAVNAALTQANEQLIDELTRARERLADMLHGPVQGRLAAASMALRLYADAQANGRPADLTKTLTTATALLDQAVEDLDQLGQSPTTTWESLAVGLEHVRQTWGGLVEVTWTIPESMDRAAITPVVTVIEELVTNASRHADARHVEVIVRPLPDSHIEIVALNDGRAAPADPIAGSGLGQVSRYGGRWSIERTLDERTLVRVTMGAE